MSTDPTLFPDQAPVQLAILAAFSDIDHAHTHLLRAVSRAQRDTSIEPARLRPLRDAMRLLEVAASMLGKDGEYL